MASHQLVLLLLLLSVKNSSSDDDCKELSYSSYFLQDVSSSGDIRIRPQINQYLSGNDGAINAELFTCCSSESDDSRNTYFTMQFYECPDGGDLYYTLQSWYSPCPSYNATCYPYLIKLNTSSTPKTMDMEGHPSDKNDKRMFRYTMADNVLGSLRHMRSSKYLKLAAGNSMQYTSGASTLWGFLPVFKYLGTEVSPFQAATLGCRRRKRTLEGGSSRPGRGVDRNFRGRGGFTRPCYTESFLIKVKDIITIGNNGPLARISFHIRRGYKIGLTSQGGLTVIRGTDHVDDPGSPTSMTQFEFLLYHMHSPPITSSCKIYCPKRLSLFEAVIIRLKNTTKYIDGEETENRTGVIMKTRQEDVRVDDRLLSIDYAGIVLRSYEERILRPQNDNDVPVNGGGSIEEPSVTSSLHANISMAGIHPHLQQHADQRFYRVHRTGIRARLESVLSPGDFLAILESANGTKLVLTKLRLGTSNLKFDFKVPFDTRFYGTRPILLPGRRCNSFDCYLDSLPDRRRVGQY